MQDEIGPAVNSALAYKRQVAELNNIQETNNKLLAETELLKAQKETEAARNLKAKVIYNVVEAGKNLFKTVVDGRSPKSAIGAGSALSTIPNTHPARVPDTVASYYANRPSSAKAALALGKVQDYSVERFLDMILEGKRKNEI